LIEMIEVFMRIIPRMKKQLAIVAIGVALLAASSARAQETTNQQRPNPSPNAASQDPITQLNLSPEQREKIRTIREQTKDERAAINRRFRTAQIALEQAIDSPESSEALIEQRARELGEAQAAQTRMRALAEVRIRRVLTPEQIVTLRQLRAQAQEQRREQRLGNQGNQGPGRMRPNGRGLQNQRNGMMPARRGGVPQKQIP
jgi:Spy/CpxP family protein refolding chaperone